ncbi:DUF3902 family protein [Bacillus cereus]
MYSWPFLSLYTLIDLYCKYTYDKKWSKLFIKATVTTFSFAVLGITFWYCTRAITAMESQFNGLVLVVSVTFICNDHNIISFCIIC